MSIWDTTKHQSVVGLVEFQTQFLWDFVSHHRWDVGISLS